MEAFPIQVYILKTFLALIQRFRSDTKTQTYPLIIFKADIHTYSYMIPKCQCFFVVCLMYVQSCFTTTCTLLSQNDNYSQIENIDNISCIWIVHFVYMFFPHLIIWFESCSILYLCDQQSSSEELAQLANKLNMYEHISGFLYWKVFITPLELSLSFIRLTSFLVFVFFVVVVFFFFLLS